MNAKPPFSGKTAAICAVGHFVLTLVCFFVIFVQGFGAFTHSVEDQMALWEQFMWVWSPLVRIAYVYEYPSLPEAMTLALVWSCVMGAVAGFIYRDNG